MSKYYIEVHCGFKIKEYVESVRNCKVTKDTNEALKFATKKLANLFIKEHDGNGLNSDTAQIVKVVKST